MFNFNTEHVIYNNDINTLFKGKDIILKNVYNYNGPITMQYLPFGGIQSVFDFHIIINTIDGFIATDNVIYEGISYSSKDFILKYQDIVNEVLGY